MNENLSDGDKIALIAEKFASIMELLGLDLSDPSLSKTPQRVAKMYVEEIFSGLNPANFPPITLIDSQELGNELSFSNQTQKIAISVDFCTFCEHHFVPIEGKATISYRPKGKMLGVGNVAQIVRYFSRRPQLQERLTHQIADCISEVASTPDVAVTLTARHQCMIARGIEAQNSQVTTWAWRGSFLQEANLPENI